MKEGDTITINGVGWLVITVYHETYFCGEGPDGIRQRFAKLKNKWTEIK